MSIRKDAVAELVAYGIPDSQIGEAFGVSPQHIANLRRDDEELQTLIQEKATDIAVRQHNNKVTEEQIEVAMLEKIKEQVELSDSLIETTRCLQLLKDIQGKGRAMQHGAAAEVPNTLVLNMGEAQTVQIQRTGNNEIISIAGRDMAPMPARRIIEAVREQKDGKEPFQRRPAECEQGETPRASLQQELATDAL